MPAKIGFGEEIKWGQQLVGWLFVSDSAAWKKTRIFCVCVPAEMKMMLEQ